MPAVDKSESPDKACMSYWFPKLLASGVATPETILIKAPQEGFGIIRMICGSGDCTELESIRDEVISAGDKLGWPCFLRSGHTSNKHDWEESCFVEDAEKVGPAICNISEFHECVFIPPPKWWAVRRLLKTEPAFTAFGGMPVTLEMRVFIEGGEIRCEHFYWPDDCIRYPSCKEKDVPKLLKQLRDQLSRPLLSALVEPNLLEAMRWEAVAVGEIFADDGAWSLDMLWAEGRWWATDMAPASISHHDLLCPNYGLWPDPREVRKPKKTNTPETTPG